MPDANGNSTLGLLIRAESGPGVLRELTGVIARHNGNITLVEIIESRPPEARIYFEIDVPDDAAALQEEIQALAVVRQAIAVNTFQKIYGKRIIIMGGGAQVG